MSEPLPEHLQRLNPEQFDAVNTLAGPMLVLAGAGSGKTRVLTRRIAHMIHNEVPPEAILAVTFTKKAAVEMKERVVDMAGDLGDKVWVSTFHSTCCRILRKEIEALGFTRRFAIYDDDDQLRVVRMVMQDFMADVKMADARIISSKIDWHKNRLDTPDLLTASHRSHDRQMLIRVWRAYDEALKAADAVDFNDLIGLTVRLFTERKDILARWQEIVQYILVDEYQDTNRGQYQLLAMLAAKHRNLVVVGDDDQSIYGFRGADISNILGFEKDYPEAKVIRLEQNYRCSGNILKVSNAVVAKNSGRMEKKLWTDAPDGAKVSFLACQTLRDEAQRVARACHKLRRQGFKYGQMAIIYRTNATARFFESALRQLGIPHKVIGGRKLYERREVRDILSYVRIVANPADDAAFLRVVNVPSRGVGPKTISTLREEAANRGEPLMRAARAAAMGSSKSAQGLAAFVRIIDELTDAFRDMEPHELVAQTMDTSGYLAMLDADRRDDGKITLDAKTRLTNLEELVRDARSGAAKATEAHNEADRLRFWLDNITLAAQADDIPDGGEVVLLTVHNAKGLEFPVVFVVQMMEEYFPHARAAEEGIDEERRLAYVAFTRAMKRLVVSRSSTAGRPGQDPKPASPSRFLFGIPLDACDGQPPTGDPDVDEPDPPGLDDQERSYLQKVAKDHRERAREATPDGDFTLIEVETIDQLRRDTRVHHHQHGFGRVRRCRKDGLDVQFGHRVVRLPLAGAGLQLVCE
jgi:DNA helicase II / ATP-dependent DNA helicase PcrA